MKRWIAGLVVAAVSMALLPDFAEARRLGGGTSSGMKRTLPARTAPDSVPAKPGTPDQAGAPAQATPGNAAGATAAAAAPARRSWMAPLAGLAAGLGIAALASAFGFGPALANIMTMLLLLVVGVVVVRWLMRRFAGPAASARMATPNGAPLGERSAASPWPVRPTIDAMPATAAGAGTAATAGAAAALPAGFDAAGFERIAKMIFIRMQTANDAGDLNDLRAFTTPEMFAAIRLELQERAGRPQRTDVVQIDAQVLDVAEEAQQQVVSVRFHGLVREEQHAGAEPFDEVWHLVKPKDGSREWAIAGIEQTAAA
jgi:predicted lipid-binding transport protein (Tim44 family)